MKPLTEAGKKRKHEEQDEQIKLVVWLKKRGILHQASGNGVHCHRLERMKQARMGVSKGFPDILIPIARKGSNSLYIEMKKKAGGLLSDEQRWWRDELKKAGNMAVRCNGSAEAIEIVENYLGLTNGESENGQ